MLKYPELKEPKENSFFSKIDKVGKDPLQTSTEIINDEICLDDDYEKKERSFPSKSPPFKNKDSFFTKLQMPKDPFMDKREVEIKEVKTTTEWFKMN